MKKFLHFSAGLCLALFTSSSKAQVCNASGNYAIFANYDGGDLTINVDVNIPNLKIGIVSYEAVKVTITGPFVGNVTAVDYSGYNNSPNTNCMPAIPSIPTTTITGFGSPTINTIPAATMSDPDGYPFIICAYNCVTGPGSTGGCNTYPQIQHYYQTMFGGTMYGYFTQYGCWNGTVALSGGGTWPTGCCPLPAAAPTADFNMSTDTLCAGECVDLSDLSTNSPTSWNWTLSGSTTATSTMQNPTVCYNTPGSYNITLVATNAIGSGTVTKSIYVPNVNTGVSVVGYTMTSATTGGSYQWINCTSGAPVAGATGMSYTATSNGLYAVVVTKDNCSDTSNCTNITGIGVEQLFLEENISMYPNPTNGLVTIEDKGLLMKGGTVTLQNALGETIQQVNIQGTRTLVDLGALSKGVYIIRMESTSGKVVRKLVRE